MTLSKKTLTSYLHPLGITFFIILSLSACSTQRFSMQPSDFFTPEYVQLIKLIQKGKKEQAQALIDGGLPLDIYGEQGITPLFWFIAKNDLSGTELTLQLGADPNLPEKQYGNTPLNKVIGGETKYDAWVKLLLEYGANPNIVDHNGQPPLFAAVAGKTRSQIDLLLNYNADVNLQDRTGRNAALYAAFLNNYALVYYLIEQGANSRNYSQGGADIA